MNKLEDDSPMPFGKHKDLPMSDVPASYFFWLWSTQGMKDDKVSPVAAYIRANISALEIEYPDGIW